jgi:hypothetical protein
MSESQRQSAETEHQYHHYTSHTIPWFVRLMWLGFWIIAIAYTVRLMFPAMKDEIFSIP